MNTSSIDISSFLIEPDVLRGREGDFLLIDTRPSKQYGEGHIPGAINLCSYDRLVRSTSEIGLNRFTRELLAYYTEGGVSTARPVVVYEDTTGMVAARECWMLQFLGHPDVRILHGGLNAWQELGGTLATDTPDVISDTFAAHPQSHMVIGIDGILTQSAHDHVAVLDVRSYEEFTGIDGSSCCPRQGRIPDAIRIEWTAFLDQETGRFNSPEVILHLLQEAGIDSNDEIITYCHRGARSAAVYYALRLAGCARVKNFIGSWHEWAVRNDIPIETGA